MDIPVRRYSRLLATYMLPHWRWMLLLVIILVLGTALQLLGPHLIRTFLDMATRGALVSTLLLQAGIFCLAGLAANVCQILLGLVSAHVSWRATNALRIDLVRHCLHLDLSFHHIYGPGELIERVDGDVHLLSNFFSQFAAQLLGNLLLTFGVLLVVFAEDWRLGAMFLICTVITLGVLYRVRNAAAPYWQAGRQASAMVLGFLEERFGGLVDLRANGALSYVQRRFAEANRVQFQHSRTATVLAHAIGSGTALLLVLGSIACLAIGVALFQAGSLTIGTLYLITAYASLVLTPLRQIIAQIDDLQKATASITRIEALQHWQPTIHDGPGLSLDPGALAVAVSQISFRYPLQDQPIPEAASQAGYASESAGILPAHMLDGISFRLAPGEVLGLIGRTGSGKTTLTRLLLRFYDPLAGTIALNGHDIRMARLADLRAHIGVVTQDVRLFHASLRDNLALFDTTVDDRRLVGVLDELGLQRWYTSLPHGLDTIVTNNSLSAGEAQLLAMARVFLKNPGLLILDEATSRLDPLTEHLIEAALDRLLVGRTALIIAHRLRTVRRADTILLLDQGRIREYGPRTQLASDPYSAFAQLVRLGTEELPL
jgi:ABC-type multidrug transport system fused ATPase/permease subunit